MKTEFIDVSDTQKNLVVEIDSTGRRCRDRQGVARLQQGGAHPRVPAGQGADEGRPPALPRSDPPRRRARADPARGGRGAARARRRAGRYARHQGRRRRGRPAAQVHRVVRDRAADRAGRVREPDGPPPDSRGSKTRPSSRRSRSCASGPRATSRSRIAAIELGDSVLMDLVRTAAKKTEEPLIVIPGQERPQPETETDKHDNVTVDIGAPGQSAGVRRGADRRQRRTTRRRSTCPIRRTTPSRSSPGRRSGTTSTIKAIRKRVVPELDDEFAKDLGEFDSLDALRTRVRADLEHEASHEAEREMRAELLKQLSTRVQFDVPASLLDREIDRRVEEFVRRLMEQQIDPMQTNINWEEFRERQREGGGRVGEERAGAGRSRAPRERVGRRTRSSRPRSAATPSAPAGPPRPCGPGWRRRGAWAGSTQVCAGRRRCPSFLSRATGIEQG